MKRRDFLKASLATGGAFVLGINFAGCGGGDASRMRDALETTGQFRPNAYITVTPDDRVLVAVGKTEMGQGIFTSHAMLVAEELEIDVEKVEPYHENGPDFQTVGNQITGGSTSLAQSFVPIRRAAASAREMFIGAAAAKWSCPKAECRAENGHIVHKSGKKLRFGELTEAAAAQEIPDDPKIKDPKDFKVVGTDTRRVDMVEKIKGDAVFGIDADVEGKLTAIIIKPPVMHSSVKSLDAVAAKEMDGIVDIFEFERGVAVVAEKYWQARRAEPKINVEWDLSELANFNSADMSEAAREQITTPGVEIRDDGDVDDIFDDENMTVIDVMYESPYLAHSPLEPMNALVSVKGDRAELRVPTQWQSAAQADVAFLLEIPRENVTLHTTYLGGGFGRRLMIDFIIEATLISKRMQKPIHLIWSREEDTRGGYYRPYNLTRMKGAVDKSGKARAIYYHNMSQSLLNLRDWLPSMLPDWMPRVSRLMMGRTAGNAVESDTLPNMLATEGAHNATFDIENLRVEYTQIHVDVPVTFWRSVGHSYNGFVMESFVDELALAADRDPVDFRRELLKKDKRKLGALEKVVELSKWGEELEDGWGRGIAVHKSFGTYCAQVIEAGVFDGELKVRKVWCVVDCGIAVNPDIVKSQMESCIVQGLAAAIHQRIDFVNGEVPQGNFDTFKLLRMHETPEIETHVMASNEAPTGVGEPGLPPVAPALAGAIFQATGKRLRSMPFVDALREA